MPSPRLPSAWQILTAVTALLIAKVTVSIVMNYGDYLPADFDTGFLQGRRSYFWGAYSWAFYTHIVSGPCSLLLGLLLLSKSLRLRAPAWHRRLGRIQVANVALLLTPSGLWMARYAETGAVAGTGFGVLALLTGTCAVVGWKSAVSRRFAEHRRWMTRCFMLLCAAVVLRLQAGLATVTEFDADWLYPFAAWTSWLVPLLINELIQKSPRRPLRSWIR
ncbi:MAG: DUF2306 domain-containing protein [Planctomycetaceae bacterium]